MEVYLHVSTCLHDVVLKTAQGELCLLCMCSLEHVQFINVGAGQTHLVRPLPHSEVKLWCRVNAVLLALSVANCYLRIVEHVAAAGMARGVVRDAIRLGAHRSVFQVITVAAHVAFIYQLQAEKRVEADRCLSFDSDAQNAPPSNVRCLSFDSDAQNVPPSNVRYLSFGSDAQNVPLSNVRYLSFDSDAQNVPLSNVRPLHSGSVSVPQTGSALACFVCQYGYYYF